MPARVEYVEYDISDMKLSGLIARPAPDEPSRGVLLAVHGGGSRAAYWHRDAAPHESLLVLGASLGWTVLAIDRPGYGASAGLERSRQGLDAQSETLFALLELLGDVPVFVAAHSMGGLVTLRMGADGRGRDLLGLAVAGVPLTFTEERLAAFAAIPSEPDTVPSRGGETPATFFGPVGSYDPALLTRAGRVVAPVPMAEFQDARTSPFTLPDTLARVRVPVQWTVAEFERANVVGLEILASARQLLVASPYVETRIQPGVGHNISLHHAARAYHLRVLAFAEECLLARASTRRGAGISA